MEEKKFAGKGNEKCFGTEIFKIETLSQIKNEKKNSILILNPLNLNC